jgi:hypothetical protein
MNNSYASASASAAAAASDWSDSGLYVSALSIKFL